VLSERKRKTCQLEKGGEQPIKQYKIELTPYEVLEFKYKVLREIMSSDSETETSRHDTWKELLQALEQADSSGINPVVYLTMPQVLQLAFLTLWDMDHKTDFDSESFEYGSLFQTLAKLGLVEEEQPIESPIDWLIPKVYKKRKKKLK